MNLDHARRVADSLLYEGYVLYPYRASSAKNRMRWQFGVAMPPAYAAADPSERSGLQADCLAERIAGASLDVLVRFLQVRRRESGGPNPVDAWDEGIEREVRARVPLDALPSAGIPSAEDAPAEIPSAEDASAEIPIRVPGDRQVDAGSGTVWTSCELEAALTVEMQRVDSPYGLARLRVRLDNRTRPGTAPATRAEALPHALVSAHVLLQLNGGDLTGGELDGGELDGGELDGGRTGARFVSLEAPPSWAREDADRCEHAGWWPCLAGPAGCENVVLAAPIIVADHPEIAPESPGDLFDATEIDEILTLRTLALTDDEKREARATDPRAAAVIDRVEGLPGEILERLHGAVRSVRPTPWWDPEADTGVDPETDTVEVDGVTVGRGSTVRLRPGIRRADAQDLFLAGRVAVVQAVLHDVDEHVHLAVTPQDDPGAEFTRGPGRYLFFAPDEVEPLGGQQ